MRLRVDFALFLILWYRETEAIFFGNLFGGGGGGGGCDCPQSCPAQAPAQPCQMFCPQLSCQGSSYSGSYSPPASFSPSRYPPPPSPFYASGFPMLQPPPSPQSSAMYPTFAQMMPSFQYRPANQPLQQQQPIQLSPPTGLSNGYQQAAPQQPPSYRQMSYASAANQAPSPQAQYSNQYPPPPPPPPQPIPLPPTSAVFPASVQYEAQNGQRLQAVNPQTQTQPSANRNEPESETYEEEEEPGNRNSGDFSGSESTEDEPLWRANPNDPNPRTGYRDDLAQDSQLRLPRTDSLTSEEKFELAMRKGALDYEDGGQITEPIDPTKNSVPSREGFDESPFNEEDNLGNGLSFPKAQPPTDAEVKKNFKLKSEGESKKKPAPMNEMQNQEMAIYDDLLGETMGSDRGSNPPDPSFPSPPSITSFTPALKEYELPTARRPYRPKAKRQHPSKCTSDKLRSIMQRSMSSSPSTSKQMVYSSVRSAFDDKSPDVICSRASFSYIVVTSPIYCEHRKPPVTCFVYFQP